MRTILLTVTALILAGAPLVVHAQPAGETRTLQGDADSWANDPHIRAFYDLSVRRLRGVANPDLAAYEQEAYAHFRAFGASRGMNPQAMQDHLKLIPRQVAQIAKSDPHVLDSYEAFQVALVGPR